MAELLKERKQVHVQEKKGERPELDLLERSMTGRLERCGSHQRPGEVKCSKCVFFRVYIKKRYAVGAVYCSGQ